MGTIGTLLRPPAGWKPTKEQRKKWAREGGFDDEDDEEEEEAAEEGEGEATRRVETE